MDIVGVTKLELSPDEYLCTFRNKTFFVKRTSPGMEQGWIISQEVKGGKLEAVEGIHRTPEAAMSYFKELVTRKKKVKEKVTRRKGGVVIHKKYKKGDRLVIDLNGRFFSGNITSSYSRSFSFQFDANIPDDEGFQIWSFNWGDPRIVGKCSDKTNIYGPIPANRLNEWLIDEEPEEEFRFEPLFNIDNPIEQKNLKIQYMNYRGSLHKFINEKVWVRIMLEYFKTHKVTIFKGMQESAAGGLREASYWVHKNEVSLNQEHLEKVNRRSAFAGLHEVIHYKLWPVKKQMQKYLKDNLCDWINLDEMNPSVRKWLAMFLEAKGTRYKLTVRKVRHLIGEYLEDLPNDPDEEFDVLYGFTNYYELPSVVISCVATNLVHYPPFEKIYMKLFSKFERQFLK